MLFITSLYKYNKKKIKNVFYCTYQGLYIKPTSLYVTAVNIKKSHIFPYGYILELYSFVSVCWCVCVCVCVKDIRWKFSIYYKFTIKESLKLTKGITWRHSNIVLKLEKMKFTNTLKNNVQLVEEINGTKRTKQLQNKKTNIEHKMPCLSQLINRGRRCRSNRKNLFSPHCCLVKEINI